MATNNKKFQADYTGRYREIPEGSDLSGNETSRIIHDLYQPLTAINNYAEVGSRLSENGPETANEAELFARIGEQAQRMKETCREIEQLIVALSKCSESM